MPCAIQQPGVSNLLLRLRHSALSSPHPTDNCWTYVPMKHMCTCAACMTSVISMLDIPHPLLTSYFHGPPPVPTSCRSLDHLPYISKVWHKYFSFRHASLVYSMSQQLQCSSRHLDWPTSIGGETKTKTITTVFSKTELKPTKNKKSKTVTALSKTTFKDADASGGYVSLRFVYCTCTLWLMLIVTS